MVKVVLACVFVREASGLTILYKYREDETYERMLFYYTASSQLPSEVDHTVALILCMSLILCMCIFI